MLSGVVLECRKDTFYKKKKKKKKKKEMSMSVYQSFLDATFSSDTSLLPIFN